MHIRTPGGPSARPVSLRQRAGEYVREGFESDRGIVQTSVAVATFGGAMGGMAGLPLGALVGATSALEAGFTGNKLLDLLAGGALGLVAGPVIGMAAGGALGATMAVTAHTYQAAYHVWEKVDDRLTDWENDVDQAGVLKTGALVACRTGFMTGSLGAAIGAPGGLVLGALQANIHPITGNSLVDTALGAAGGVLLGPVVVGGEAALIGGLAGGGLGILGKTGEKYLG